MGILEAASGIRSVTDALRRFQISYAGHQLASSNGGLGWLDSEIRQKHGFLTFQAPDRVADAIRLVSNVSLWAEVGIRLSRPVNDVRNQLQLIVERRNKIAHEADADLPFPAHAGQFRL